MTAASSPQPRDEEVCAVSIWPSWSDRRVKCGKPFDRDGRCIPYGHPRPAAPSEPPTADSPTPGTCPHEAWEVDSAGQRGRCVDCRTWLGPAAPSPVGTTEPPAEVWTYQADQPRSVGTIKPPAEAQQEDEPFRSILGDVDRQCYDARRAWRTTETRVPEDHAFIAGWAAALAARPSADTETLLASVLRKLMAADSFLALSTHRSATGMPVQFTLDDTSIEVTDAEADAIKATVGW